MFSRTRGPFRHHASQSYRSRDGRPNIDTRIASEKVNNELARLFRHWMLVNQVIRGCRGSSVLWMTLSGIISSCSLFARYNKPAKEATESESKKTTMVPTTCRNCSVSSINSLCRSHSNHHIRSPSRCPCTYRLVSVSTTNQQPCP